MGRFREPTYPYTGTGGFGRCRGRRATSNDASSFGVIVVVLSLGWLSAARALFARLVGDGGVWAVLTLGSACSPLSRRCCVLGGERRGRVLRCCACGPDGGAVRPCSASVIVERSDTELSAGCPALASLRAYVSPCVILPVRDSALLSRQAASSTADGVWRQSPPDAQRLEQVTDRVVRWFHRVPGWEASRLAVAPSTVR